MPFLRFSLDHCLWAEMQHRRKTVNLERVQRQNWRRAFKRGEMELALNALRSFSQIAVDAANGVPPLRMRDVELRSRPLLGNTSGFLRTDCGQRTADQLRADRLFRRGTAVFPIGPRTVHFRFATQVPGAGCLNYHVPEMVLQLPPGVHGTQHALIAQQVGATVQAHYAELQMAMRISGSGI